MRISHGGISQQKFFAVANRLTKRTSPELEEFLSVSFGRGLASRYLRGDCRFASDFGLGLFDQLISIDDCIGDESQEACGAVSAFGEFKEFGGFVDHPSRRIAGLEGRVGDERYEERDVGLDPSDSEFLKAAFHASGGFEQVATSRGDFDKKGIVEGVDDRAAKGATGIESNSQSAGAAVVGDPSVIRSELVRWIFGGYSALNG